MKEVLFMNHKNVHENLLDKIVTDNMSNEIVSIIKKKLEIDIETTNIDIIINEYKEKTCFYKCEITEIEQKQIFIVGNTLVDNLTFLALCHSEELTKHHLYKTYMEMNKNTYTKKTIGYYIKCFYLKIKLNKIASKIGYESLDEYDEDTYYFLKNYPILNNYNSFEDFLKEYKNIEVRYEKLNSLINSITKEYLGKIKAEVSNQIQNHGLTMLNDLFLFLNDVELN